MSKFALKVFGARAVVRLNPVENTTFGGIILPNTSGEPVNEGVIVAVGEGMRLPNGNIHPMEIAVGDRVIYSPMAGAPVEVAGDEDKYLVINERDVLAVIQ